MRSIFCLPLFIFCFSVFQSLGQDVQWASEVVNYSSEYLREGAISTQVLGPPNAMEGKANRRLAWGPQKEASITGDFIHVGFAEAMPIRQIAVAESLHPGAISKITLYYTDGTKEKIYENKFPRPALTENRLFQTTFDLTKSAVQEVRIDLKTKAVNGRNMIDAIAISTSIEPIQWKTEKIVAKGKLNEAELLDVQINSPFSERMPIISPDGNTLYFARKDHPRNIGDANNDDIWVAFQQADGSWTKAVNVGAPLNNSLHNFVVAVAPTNDRLYLANEYNSKAQDGISLTELNGRSWSNPKALKIEDHYNYSPFVSYHINLDENILMMAVDRKDSRGDMDIYVSFKESNGQWTAPKNLGPDINTGDVESSVFLAADNKTIYFSTNGRDGLGGLDMYQSRRLDESWTKWSTPQNLGEPINGPGNDYNYSIPASGEYAYFSSESETGNADIFRISLPDNLLPEPVALLKGNVIDATTKEPIKATLKLQNLEDASVNRELEAKEDGTYQVVFPIGDNVGLVAEREGYFSVSESMELTDQNLEEMDGDQQMLAQVDGPISLHAAAAEQLRLKLNELDTELKQLEKKRIPRKVQLDKRLARQPYHQSDPELDALRHKYNKALRKEVPEQKEDRLTSKGESKAVDSELEEMKRKFNQYNKKKENADEEYLDLEISNGKVKNRNEASEPAEDYGFRDLQAKIWEELEVEMENEVRLELQRDLLNEVEKKVERKLKSSLNLVSKNRLRQHVVSIGREIKKELKALEGDGMEYHSKTQMEKVEREMRWELRPKVRLSLRKEWRKVVREVLQAELEYRFKKEEEVKIRKKLQNKQRKEIRAERRQKDQPVLQPKSPEVKEMEPQVKDLEYKEVQQNILMIPIREGQILPMNNVFFDANKATIKSQSTAELKRVVRFLKKNKNLVVEVGGHTNGWCSHVFANQLSQDRAKAVAEYFIEEKIDQDRIRFQGYGKNSPIATNDTPKGRKKNQRVELKILEIKSN